MGKRIYLASSWRNARQPYYVNLLTLNGYEVYDFRNPAPGNNGFHWSAIDPNWKNWEPFQFREALRHPIAEEGFVFDWDALKAADITICLLPCGRSAHLELGYAAGLGQITGVVMENQEEPELMYKLTDFMVTNETELLHQLWFHNWKRTSPSF